MGNDRELDAVMQAFGEGALAPPVDAVFPLDGARAAYERLSRAGQFGKIVIRMRDD